MTRDEEIFLNRMVPHMRAGMTFEEAGRAVLERDQYIVSQIMAWTAHSPTAEHRAEIKREIASQVYHRIRNERTN